jgi:glycerol-1-phosphate dehydrogenase [NAD(P)+]
VDKLSELLAGRLSDPDTGERLSVPVKSVVIAPSLGGMEADLVKGLGLEPPFAVVSDRNTHAALGERIEAALGRTIAIHLPGRPHADESTAIEVMEMGRAAGSYIAVGSGSINDLVKYAAARQGKRCAVFATAPSMNGYTSVNAAITVNGHKKSLSAVAPLGVFIDLGVMAQAPKRMIRAGFGDAICRSTAQADWLLAHRLIGGSYRRAPFMLFADLEDEIIRRPEALITGDRAAIECLTRVLLLSGLGMTIVGSSEPASQGEHLISHHIEMMPPNGWDEPLHGEQIAVTTLIMARLQEQMLASPKPPRLQASRLSEIELAAHFGAELGAACWREIQPKLFDNSQTEALNDRLAAIWPDLREELLAIMRPLAEIDAALAAIGAPRAYTDLGLDRSAFTTAVQYACTIRNRYTSLDLAANSGLLDAKRITG